MCHGDRGSRVASSDDLELSDLVHWGQVLELRVSNFQPDLAIVFRKYHARRRWRPDSFGAEEATLICLRDCAMTEVSRYFDGSFFGYEAMAVCSGLSVSLSS